MKAQTTTREQRVAGLGRFDLVYSEAHGCYMLFLEWDQEGKAVLADANTGEADSFRTDRADLR